MKNYQEALQVILQCAKPLAATTMPLSQAVGLTLARDAVAQVSAPAFDNSAMDGFTLNAADVETATAENPVYLEIADCLAAGEDAAPLPLKERVAAEIMTGAHLSIGATTVLPVENSVQEEGRLRFDAPVEDGRHIRRKGEDFNAGDLLLEHGETVSLGAIQALTGAGLSHLSVRPAPKAFWISTGRELVDDYSQPLGPNQIYNSSGLYGETALKQIGATFCGRQTVADDGASFRTLMQKVVQSDVDVIISTGAVSVGKYDFVRTELEAMGAEILLHRAKVRPGKPILFARLPAAIVGRDIFFFGLPGNPVSTAMGYRVFVVPFLQALMGQKAEQPLRAKLMSDATSAEHLTVFLKGQMGVDEAGQLCVTPLIGQESFRVAPMAAQNSWIIHPEGVRTLTQGTIVELLPFMRVAGLDQALLCHADDNFGSCC